MVRLLPLLSHSEAESGAISRAVAVEFRFGEQYARMLLMLSMVVMYSISCPLITPFGLVYFLFKHFVDKHNLAFVYARSKINKNVHRSAINFVMFSASPSSVHAEFLIHKVLRWSVTEPKNQDLSCPLRHHPDDFLRPDLVQLLQEAQPHQVFGCSLRRGWRGL